MLKKSEPQSLESYLAQIAHELRDLPVSARVDELREIGAHLRALVLAGQQLENLDQAQATTVALKQFGEPRAIGRKLRKAWERKQPEAWWRVVLAATFAMSATALFPLPFLQGFFAFTQGIDPQLTGAPEQISIVVLTLKIFTLCFAFSLIMFMTYIVGFISPKRSRLVIVSLLISALLLTFASSPYSLSSFWISLAAGSFVSSVTGCFFGARHGRRLLSRIADARENTAANHSLLS